MGDLEFYDENLISFNFLRVLSHGIVFIFSWKKISLSPKSGVDPALGQLSCPQRLQDDIVSPSQGHGHLAITAGSSCQWELGSFAPQMFLCLH